LYPCGQFASHGIKVVAPRDKNTSGSTLESLLGRVHDALKFRGGCYLVASRPYFISCVCEKPKLHNVASVPDQD